MNIEFTVKVIFHNKIGLNHIPYHNKILMNSQFEKALIVGDLHIPFQEKRAVNLMLRVAQDLQPDLVFLNGDIMDCWQISRYVKNPKLHDQANIQLEIEQTRSFLQRIRYMFPRAKFLYTFGNHEYRWSSFIVNNAKELYGLKGMTLEEQLELADLDIKAINTGNKENSYLWGKLLIGHFDRVNKHSGMTAKNLIEDKGISLVQNHVHRGGSSFKRAYDRDIVGYENFCLCSRNPDYVDRPNWQLGFSIVYKDKHSDFFYLEQHPITEVAGERLKTFFNGKLYTA